jgi:hypothetical protein
MEVHVMWKTALICAGVLTAAPLLAAEPASPAGNKVTTSVRGVPDCPQTGTHIRPGADGRCLAGASRVKVYTREELERTGEINLSEALRKLDPTIR